MKTSKLFIFFILIVLGLGLTYYFIRPYFRLSFDRVEVLAAVEGTSEILVQLPLENLLETDTLYDFAWKKEQLGLIELLNELKLTGKDNWEEWWIIPQLGSYSDQLAFTFIGSSSAISQAWLPEQYGASLPFEHGDIYTFQSSSGQSIYFARYHNLLLVGQYPFLVENALLAAKSEIAAWSDNDFLPTGISETKIEEWDYLIRNNKNKGAILKEIFSYSTTESIPLNWDWAALSFTALDSAAYLKGIITGLGKMHPNRNASAWSIIPPDVTFAFPIEEERLKSENLVGPSIQEWLGDDGWTIQLRQAATDTKVSPRIWLLPIADSLAYQKFKRVNKEKLSAIDRRNYQLFELEQWRDAGFFDGLSDRKLWQPWVCELDNMLLLSVYRADLEKYLDYYLSGASIVESEIFLQLKKRFSSVKQADWQAYKYWQSPQNQSNVLALLHPTAKWARHGILLAQARTVLDQTVEIEGVIQQAPKQTGTAIDWSLAIPTRDAISLLNVNDSKGQAVAGLIQNTSGQVWAFDENGNEYWQQHIAETLFDPITMLDYGSGIQRWLASTSSDVYLWDNNGTDQANYTLKDVQPTAAPTAVNLPSIDQPLFAFPTQDKQLELRFLNGQSPDNWPVKIDELVKISLLYVGQEREDLILAETIEGHNIIANSLGRVLHSTSASDSSGMSRVGATAIGSENNTNQWIKTYSDGRIKIAELSNDFSSSIKQLGKGPVDDFIALNCWGDDRLDYVVQRGSLVHLFALESDQLSERWQYRFPLAPDRIIPAMPYGILVLSNERKQIWLLNGEGELLDGFPVGGEGNAFLLKSKEGNYSLLTMLDRKLYSYIILD